MIANRPLLAAWVLNGALWLVGWVTGAENPLLVPPFVSILLAIFTVIFAPRSAPLRWTIAYRIPLGLLCASTATTLVAAGSTVVIEDHVGVLGLIGLATTSLVLVVVGWRALVRPSPRRAAVVSLLAATLPLVAMIVDVILNFSLGAKGILREDAMTITLISSLATMGSGVLVAIASITTFERPAHTDVPAARVVDASR